MNRQTWLLFVALLASGLARAVPSFIGDQQFRCSALAGNACSQFIPDGAITSEAVIESTFSIPAQGFCPYRAVSVLVLGLHGAPSDLEIRVRHATSGTDQVSAAATGVGSLSGDDLERVISLPGFPSGVGVAGLWRLNIEDKHAGEYGHLLDWRVVIDCLIPKVIVSQTGALPNLAEAGEVIGYRMNLSNGAAYAVNTTVLDPVPPGTSFVSADNGGTLVGSNVRWVVNIPANSSRELNLNLRVENPVPLNQTVISNRATVDGENTCVAITDPAVCNPTEITRKTDLLINGFE